MYHRTLLMTVVFSALTALAACATNTTSGTRTTHTPQDDTALSELVTRTVHDLPGIGTTDLSVSALDGVVTIKGRTPTRAQAQEVIEAARHVPGVQKVDYDISVDQKP